MGKRICVLFCFMFVVAAGTVFAHSVLVSSQPKDGSTVKKAVSELKLTFNTKIEKVLSLKVKELNQGQSISPETVSKGKVVKAALQQPLKKGSYEIHYRVIGEDGHAVEGEYSFQVKIPKEKQTNSPTQKDKSEDTSSGNSSVDQKDQGDNKIKTLPNESQSVVEKDSGGSPLMIGLVIALAIVVIITLVLLIRKRK